MCLSGSSLYADVPRGTLSAYELKKKPNSYFLEMGRNALAQANKRTEQHLWWCPDGGCVIKGTPKDKLYVPSPTGLIAHLDNSFVRLEMGPYGSGKTTWAIMEIIRRTCSMPAWHNGRRRAKWAVVRNTSGELHSTTLKSWLAWCDELGDVSKRQKPILNYEHTFNDGHGVVELELIFLALDRPDDVRKVKSLEVTGVYLNELSELPAEALSHFKGRLNGRYPSKEFCREPYWSGIIADTNPPDEDHWIYKDFYDKTVDGYKLFRQPPAMKKEDGVWVPNPGAENLNFLSHDYYTKLSSGQNDEFIKVFCCGEWGTVGTGKRVFPEFNPDLHVVEDLVAEQGGLIHLGWDFGLTPACAVVEITERGQVKLLKEYCGIDIGIRNFAEGVVLPALRRDFPYSKIGVSVGDPAGANRSTINEELCEINELTSIGIPTIPARTNDITPRLDAVRYFLNRMTDGKPSFLLSKKGCPTIRRGLGKDYVYKRLAVSGEERYKEKPDKNMSSHPVDALGYILTEFAGDQIARNKVEKPDPKAFYNPTMRIF